MAVDEMNLKRIKTFPNMNEIPEIYRPIIESLTFNERIEKDNAKRKERSSLKDDGFDIGDKLLSLSLSPDSSVESEKDLELSLGLDFVQDLDLDLSLDLDLNLDEAADENAFEEEAIETENFDGPEDLTEDLFEE